MNVRIAPSILAADFTRLGAQVTAVAEGGADLIHVDVMDGHFVPNITMGPLVASAVRRATSVPLDVHLMIEDPDRYLDAFVAAGASIVTVHAEAATHLHRTLTRIRELGARAGVALNPATPLAMVEDVLDEADLILVMSVNPGFGGQRFIPRSLDRIAALRAMLGTRAVDVEVDGGVDRRNARAVVTAGATVLVAGVSIFGQPDPLVATRELRSIALGEMPTPA